MQKFSSFGRKKKNRPKFDIEWICPKTFNYYRQARVHCPVLCFLELIWLTSLVHDQKTAKRVHPVDIENVKRKSFNSQQPFEKISGVHTVVTLN